MVPSPPSQPHENATCGMVIIASQRALDPSYIVGGCKLMAHAFHLAEECDITAIVVSAPSDCVDKLQKNSIFVDTANKDHLFTALKSLTEKISNVLIISAHTPLIKASTIKDMVPLLNRASDDNKPVDVIIATPARYPHEKQASNPTALLLRIETLFNALENAEHQSSHSSLEGILSSILANGATMRSTNARDEETIHVTDKHSLALAEHHYQRNMRTKFLELGATLLSPETIFFSMNNNIGKDAIIHPYVHLGPNVTIGKGAEIKSFSHLSHCTIGEYTSIGPLANISQNSEIGSHSIIGSFVEIKRSRMENEVKAKHLSYVGDAFIGKGTNIGAGMITCNYDGNKKSHTTIRPRCFVGANTSLVAPLTVGEGAYIAAGSVITHDVPENTMAIARTRQEHKKKTTANSHKKENP